VADFLTRMVEDEMETVDVKPDVAAEYTARIDAEHDTLVWTAPGLESYYRNSKGRVSSANPWRMVDYWRLTHEADPEHYRVTYRNGAHGNRKVESHSKAGQVDASIDRPSGIVRS
jgi:4-hydroxyacetophenone monooxygenase